MIKAPGFRKLTTAVYPKGDVWLHSDCVFGVKKSLVVVWDVAVIYDQMLSHHCNVAFHRGER